ncbi:hypothetical protein HOY82DRAFT_313560 [Tuber indicum]|nr:hypothetical protein HOY82DRAFT_313560 [Tuber indicum]
MWGAGVLMILVKIGSRPQPARLQIQTFHCSTRSCEGSPVFDRCIELEGGGQVQVPQPTHTHSLALAGTGGGRLISSWFLWCAGTVLEYPSLSLRFQLCTEPSVYP